MNNAAQPMVPPIHGEIFDMDDTLIESDISLREVRELLGVPPDADMLAFIRTELPVEAHAYAYRLIDETAFRGLCGSEPVDGLPETLEYLGREKLPFAVITRGSRLRAEVLLHRHGIDPEVVIGREDAEPKPSPEPIHMAARCMGVPTSALMLVGDYSYDIQAGKAAGCFSVLLRREWNKGFEPIADHVIDRLDDLIGLLR